MEDSDPSLCMRKQNVWNLEQVTCMKKQSLTVHTQYSNLDLVLCMKKQTGPTLLITMGNGYGKYLLVIGMHLLIYSTTLILLHSSLNNRHNERTHQQSPRPLFCEFSTPVFCQWRASSTHTPVTRKASLPMAVVFEVQNFSPSPRTKVTQSVPHPSQSGYKGISSMLALRSYCGHVDSDKPD